MAKKQKAMKIKRYKNTMSASKGKKAKNVFKNIFAALIAVVVLVGIGFLISGPILNFLDAAGSIEIQDNENQTNETENANNQATNEEVTPEATTIPTIKEVTNKVYYNANVNQLTNEDTLASLIDILKAKDITHCIVPVKDSQGFVYYDSDNDYAYGAKNQVLLNSELIINTLAENGIVAVANISVFKDNMITVLNRETSIFYLNTDARWLDNELAAGGKAWSNPASQETQDYIMAIVKETIENGYTEILFSDYQIPHEGYLAGMDFRASDEELINEMSELLSLIKGQAIKNNVDTIFTVDLASFKANDYSRYTQNPLELFDGEILFTTRTDSVLLEEDTNFINSIADEYQVKTGLWITDIAQDTQISGVDNYVKR